MKMGYKKSLIEQILWGILPVTISLILFVAISATILARSFLITENEEFLKEQTRVHARSFYQKFRTDIRQVESIANNDLLVNALFQSVEEKSYVEIFFNSLKFGNIPGLLTMTDYRGRHIVSNGKAVNYQNQEWVSIVIDGNTSYSEIRTDGTVLFAIPIRYRDRAEGILVLESKDLLQSHYGTEGSTDNGYQWFVVNNDNKILFSSADTANTKMNDFINDHYFLHVETIPNFQQIRIIGAINKNKALEVLNILYITMLVMVIIVLSTLFGSVYAAGKTISLPINNLINQIQQIGKTLSLDKPIKTVGSFQFDMLIDTFNELTTKLNQSKIQLKNNEKRLQSILDNLPERVLYKNVESKYLFGNKSFAESVGVSTNELPGKKDGDYFSDEISKKNRLNEMEAMGSGETLEYEKVLENKPNKKYYKTILVPLKDEAKRVIGVLCIYWDISDLRLAEQDRQNMEVQLRNAQKMEAVGALASGIAHEINTPIQYVYNNTRFVQESIEDYHRLLSAYKAVMDKLIGTADTFTEIDSIEKIRIDCDIDYAMEEVPKALGQSLDGLVRITKIVKAMKEFAHPGTDEKSFTDLNRTIQSTIDISRNEWKYDAILKTDFDPNLPQIPLLTGEFNQVILNLIVNASQAIAETDEPFEKKGEIIISTRLRKQYVEIRVIDNGCGMTEDVRKRIFDPFFTTKQVGKGSGQGLAIAWGVIVDKHQGSIEVSSEKGVFTQFTIKLPLANSTVST